MGRQVLEAGRLYFWGVEQTRPRARSLKTCDPECIGCQDAKLATMRAFHSTVNRPSYLCDTCPTTHADALRHHRIIRCHQKGISDHQLTDSTIFLQVDIKISRCIPRSGHDVTCSNHAPAYHCCCLGSILTKSTCISDFW